MLRKLGSYRNCALPYSVRSEAVCRYPTSDFGDKIRKLPLTVRVRPDDLRTDVITNQGDYMIHVESEHFLSTRLRERKYGAGKETLIPDRSRRLWSTAE